MSSKSWRSAFWLFGFFLSILAIEVVDDFLLLSLASVVYVLPLFVFLVVAYLVSCLVRKRPVRVVLSWADLPVVCWSVAIWGLVVEANLPIMPNKSLANLIEPGMVSALWCVLFAIRCRHALNGNLMKMSFWRNASFVAMPVVAVLLALLCPAIPE